MAYKTDRNIIGRQVTTAAEEASAVLDVVAGSGMKVTAAFPSGLTAAEYRTIFADLRSVDSGLVAIGPRVSTGWSDLTTTDLAVATGKGYTVITSAFGWFCFYFFAPPWWGFFIIWFYDHEKTNQATSQIWQSYAWIL